MTKKVTDKQVQKLLDTIASKRSKIKALDKPNWKTSCTINPSFNVHKSVNILTVRDVNTLASILGGIIADKTQYNEAAAVLGVPTDEFKYQGYTYEEWEHDIKLRAQQINIILETNSLEVLESRVEKLMSKDLKDSIEFDSILELLK